MTSVNVNDTKKMINPLVMLIPIKFIEAILTLNRKLQGKNVDWAISGDSGEALQTVHVLPNCVEIITSREGAQQIRQAVLEYNPQEIKLHTEILPRMALIEEKEYPVKIRSNFFEFYIGEIKTKVYSDLQYQIGEWEWGDKIEFKPDYVFVVGQKIAVMPLEIKSELYLGLGWKDRVEKIRTVLNRKVHARNRYQQKKPINHIR